MIVKALNESHYLKFQFLLSFQLSKYSYIWQVFY